ncbi:uncharacterized protein LOC131284529 [Anopheles ziemanni]|uniref:uncharacterized protein LOC131259259 n=1 Tax=Anopheles coustani TaxID=139045 RepID=UPI002659BA5A|nr:uncharacterized protein LOC131259259 [Anopheles coustani]XP_058169370.1 uncharacterized protein LOC131284529 [Anopheles ziemanni]
MSDHLGVLLLLITSGALLVAEAAASGKTHETTAVGAGEKRSQPGRGPGAEVHQADVSVSEPVAVRLGKAAKSGSSPITYIKTLPSDGASGEDRGHGHPANRLANHRAKPRNGNRFAPKSLDVAAPKDLSNAELFGKLGLGKVRPATNHHKKRLAEESRHYGRPDDSHMYVIKLPPNPYYYTHNVAPQNSISSVGKQVPVGFKSNGKPARIYHWNIPVLKKMLGAKQSRHPNSRRHDDIDELIDIKEIPTWTKPWEGAPREKSLLKASTGLAGEADRAGKRKLPTYYAPAKKQTGGGKSKKHAGSKYNTSGSNGKPQSFYILGDKDSRTKIVGHSADV